MALLWKSEGVILVSRPLAGEIMVLDSDSLRHLRTIRAGAGARFFDLDETGRRLFVGNYLEGTLSCISFEDGKTTGIWKLGPLVRGVKYDPERNVVYTCSLAGAFMVDVGEAS